MEAYGRAGSSVDYTTVWRWTQTFAPEVQRRLRGQAERIDLAHGRDSCTDRSAVGRTCFRAVVSGGQNGGLQAYPKLVTVKQRIASSDERWLIPTTTHHTFSPKTDREVIPRPLRELQVNSVAVVGIERNATRIIASSNQTTATSNGVCGPCKAGVRQRLLAR